MTYSSSLPNIPNALHGPGIIIWVMHPLHSSNTKSVIHPIFCPSHILITSLCLSSHKRTGNTPQSPHNTICLLILRNACLCTGTLIIGQTYLPIRPSAALDFLAVATATPSKIRLADELISCVVLLNINVSVHSFTFLRIRQKCFHRLERIFLKARHLSLRYVNFVRNLHLRLSVKISEVYNIPLPVSEMG